MNAPVFVAGQSGVLGSIRWRIIEGRKGPDDLVLELEGRNGYAPAKMALGGLMADFFFQNEDRLYPRHFGFRGGDLYVNFVLACVRSGWRGGTMKLEAEREQRRRRVVSSGASR